MFALCAIAGYRNLVHLGGVRGKLSVATFKAAGFSLAQRDSAQTGTAMGSCKQWRLWLAGEWERRRWDLGNSQGLMLEGSAGRCWRRSSKEKNEKWDSRACKEGEGEQVCVFVKEFFRIKIMPTIVYSMLPKSCAPWPCAENIAPSFRRMRMTCPWQALLEILRLWECSSFCSTSQFK